MPKSRIPHERCIGCGVEHEQGRLMEPGLKGVRITVGVELRVRGKLDHLEAVHIRIEGLKAVVADREDPAIG